MPIVALVIACADPGYDGDPIVSRVEHLGWKVKAPKQLDLLFVVDNSPAMATHEATWSAVQRDLIGVLETVEGGLPSIHIGVVTTDLGTLGRDGQMSPEAAGCSSDGGRGNLRGGGASVQGTFISDIKLTDGTRQRNYAGALEDAFATMATAGTQGCPYVQPLEAMRRALDKNPANAGFLREDAYLFVVFVTPNDDCSFARGGFAVDSGAINARVCVVRESELVDVEEYEAFLRSLKTDASQIMVSVIAGPAEPVQLVDGPEGLQVAPSCTFAGASALPAQRLRALADRFPNRSTFTSICQQNWSDGVAWFAELPSRHAANQCFVATPLDLEPDIEGIQAECSVTYLARGIEQLIPACEAEPVRPCWRVVNDAQRCSTRPSSLIEVLPAIEPAVDALVWAQCLVE